MATQSSLAFQDDFTTPHGAAYFVSVDPVFDEQINEAVTLIARSRPENVRVSYISQFTAAAKLAAPTSSAEAAGEEEEEDKEEEEDEKKEVPEETEEMREAKRKVVKDLVASVRSLAVVGNDREFEGFSNLVLSLVLSLFAPSHPDFSTLLLSFTDTLTFNADRTANPSLSARYAAVATLFNALPNPSSDPSAPSSLRLTVLLKLISCAASNEDFPVIRPALERLESWLSLWGFGLGTPGEEEGNAAISTIVAALSSRSKKAEARSILLAHLSTPSAVSGQAITPSSSAAALVSQLIVLSLALPDVFDFSTLSSLAAPSVPALAQLLAIFQSGDVEAFEKFAVDNAQVLAEQKLEKDQLERKLRLLALAELCSKKVGELVSYAEIAQALRLSKAESDDGEEVETWVIDAIRASLISGRLSQPLLSFHVTRAAPRSFTPAHWMQLQGRLEGWRTSLDSILDSVAKGLQVDGGAGQGAIEVRERREESSAQAAVAV